MTDSRRVETSREERQESRWRQSKLREFTPEAKTCIYLNIPPFGDLLTPRQEAERNLIIGF